MSRSLIQIEQDALALERLIFESQDTESGADARNALETWLAEVEIALATKADSYYAVMQRAEATEERLARQISELQAARRTVGNFRERLKDRIKVTMAVFGDEIHGTWVKFKRSASRPALHIAGDLPPEFTTVETVVTPNTDKIRKALEDGMRVGDCKLITTWSLRTTVSKGKT